MPPPHDHLAARLETKVLAKSQKVPTSWETSEVFFDSQSRTVTCGGGGRGGGGAGAAKASASFVVTIVSDIPDRALYKKHRYVVAMPREQREPRTKPVINRLPTVQLRPARRGAEAAAAASKRLADQAGVGFIDFAVPQQRVQNRDRRDGGASGGGKGTRCLAVLWLIVWLPVAGLLAD